MAVEELTKFIVLRLSKTLQVFVDIVVESSGSNPEVGECILSH
jgi:hypothetical protein